MGRSFFAGLLVAAAAVGCAATPRRAAQRPAPPLAERAVPAGELTTSALVARAMPAVVLLLNNRPDGKITYGAGLVVENGLVLTSEHVVADAKTLGAILYKPGRPGYTPMDGGLSRYLFENQADVVPAHLIAGDATSDLAVVRIDVDTSKLPRLAIASEPVKPGDRVLSLGHPQETVWSFTEGVVGAIQQGAIQHDAAIGPGSSGGPLLNARGEVVGINVAKVVSEPRGLAFARPMAFASRYLGEAFANDVAGQRSLNATLEPLDQSTPEAAAVACWRGQEIGRVDVGECFDWDSGWAEYQKLAGEALKFADADARARIRTLLDAPDAKVRWISDNKRHAAGYFVDTEKRMSPPNLANLPREVTAARAQAEREEEALFKKHPELKQLHADLEEPKLFKARLKHGIRAGRVARLGDRAWVELVGRNVDGSLYSFTELYAKVGGRWLQRMPSTPEDEARLPADFAAPLETYRRYRAHKLSWLVAGEGVSCDPEPAMSPATPVAHPPAPVSGAAPVSADPNEGKACTSACDRGKSGGVL